VSKTFLKSLRRRNRALLARLAAFNTDPAAYAAPGWLEELAPPFVRERLLASARGRRALSRRLARARDLGGPVWDFRDARLRLALVDGAALERAVFLAGLAANGAALAKVIDRDHVAALRAALGEADYAFALRRAPLLAGPAAAPFADPDAAADPAGAARRSGARLLAACLSGEAPGLLARVALRFAPDRGPKFSDEPHPDREAAGNVLRRILSREVSPEWAALFA
jgi:hypothetical protein